MNRAGVTRARWRRASLLLLALVAPLGVASCETFVESEDCNPSASANPNIVYDGGQPDSPCVYWSSAFGPSGTAFDGEYLLFNGGMHYALRHHLACPPTAPTAYLSFDEFGTLNGGQAAYPAGNQEVIEGVDDTFIYVANDSCSDYWLLVTATVDPSTCAACK